MKEQGIVRRPFCLKVELLQRRRWSLETSGGASHVSSSDLDNQDEAATDVPMCGMALTIWACSSSNENSMPSLVLIFVYYALK